MTLPRERTMSVQNVEDFLMRLLYSDLTPKVPKKIREEARGLLRHYPNYLDLKRAFEGSPNSWGEPEDRGGFVDRYLKEGKDEP